MKNLKSLFTLSLLTLTLAANLFAQETEAVVNSGLVGVSLPANAQRVLPNAVPKEVNDALDSIVTAGEGKLRKGKTEVLIWSGSGYKKANAATIVNRLTDTLKVDGWQYSVEGNEDGLTVFSLLKEAANSRAVFGFYGATDDALVFAWMEVLPNNGNSSDKQAGRTSNENVSNSSSTGNARSIVGTWTNGSVSMLSEKNLSTGQISSRGGSTYKYVFNADGSFSFVGLINSTMYGCTTSLFNDKRGKYEVSGSQITLIPSKNFWRNMYSCSPSSNKERDYVLDRETYTFSTKRDEYGATLICLADEKGESCYRKEE